MLISGGAMFIAVWNYNHFDNMLVTYLYRMRKKDGSDEQLAVPLTNPINYICDKLPKKCQCCRKTRRM